MALVSPTAREEQLLQKIVELIYSELDSGVVVSTVKEWWRELNRIHGNGKENEVLSFVTREGVTIHTPLTKDEGEDVNNSDESMYIEGQEAFDFSGGRRR